MSARTPPPDSRPCLRERSELRRRPHRESKKRACGLRVSTWRPGGRPRTEVRGQHRSKPSSTPEAWLEPRSTGGWAEPGSVASSGRPLAWKALTTGSAARPPSWSRRKLHTRPRGPSGNARHRSAPHTPGSTAASHLPPTGCCRPHSIVRTKEHSLLSLSTPKADSFMHAQDSARFQLRLQARTSVAAHSRC